MNDLKFLRHRDEEYNMRTLKLIIMAVVAITTSACGKAYIEPEFMPYVQTFEDATGKRVDISMKFVDRLDKDDIIKGMCWNRGFTKDIEISAKHWNWGMSEASKEALILHELGHCVLGREHTSVEDTMDEGDNCPNSIMDKNSAPYWCYEKHKDHYLNELNKQK
jgi:hypothetical protein